MFRTLVLALVASLAVACPEKQVRSFSPAQDREALASSAELFWHALRWNDVEGAAALLEQSTERLAFLSDWSDSAPMQITDYQLVHIELSDPGPEAERLEGVVVVKVEGITTSYSVKSELLHQTWYRSGEAWFLDPESLPYRE
jgi:hypothetical protein